VIDQAELELVRVPGLAEQLVPGDDRRRIGSVIDALPVRPAGEAVDRVLAGRFGQVQLLIDALERVLPVRDPVRPREQVLAESGMRRLVLAVREQDRAPAVRELPQPAADTHHRPLVPAATEDPLLT
jgi:hypothetical protein